VQTRPRYSQPVNEFRVDPYDDLFRRASASDSLSTLFKYYPSWHKSNKREGNLLLWKACSSGLGDNIQNLMSGYVVAVLLRRALVVKFEGPSFAGLGPSTFDWREEPGNQRHFAEIMVPVWREAPAHCFFRSDHSFPAFTNSLEDVKRCPFFDWKIVSDSLPHSVPQECEALVNTVFMESCFFAVTPPHVMLQQVLKYVNPPGLITLNLSAVNATQGPPYQALLRATIRPHSEVLQLMAEELTKFKVAELGYWSMHIRAGTGVNESRDSRFSVLSRNLTATGICIATSLVSTISNAVNFEMASDIKAIYIATDTCALREIIA
jgi:hypothetical protein